MRRALRYLVVFLVLVVVAAVAAVFLIPREQVVALAVDQVRAATGRELTLTGDLSPSFWPVLGVRTGPVTLSNAAWGEAPTMVSASAAQIGVELLPLLSSEVKVTELRLVDPVVALERGPDGKGNWEFGDGAAATQGTSASAAPGEVPKISLPEAVIENGTITFHDLRSGQRIELSELDLKAGLEAFDRPLTLAGSGRWNGKRASLDAFIDTPAAAMSGGRAKVRLALASDAAKIEFEGDLQQPPSGALPLVNGRLAADLPDPSGAMAWATGLPAPAELGDIRNVKLDGNLAATENALALAAKGSVAYKGRSVGFDLKADGGKGWLDSRAFTVAAAAKSDGLFTFSFNGPVNAGTAIAAEGPLKLTVADLRALAEWAGGTAPDLPPGMNRFGLDTRLALKGTERVALSGLSLQLGDTAMRGDASVYLGAARPLINARLESGPLDLSPFMAKGGGNGGAASAGPSGWSTEPLDLSALRAVDADVAVLAESIDLGDIEIGRSDIAATLRNGRLDMTIARVDAYGGGINGTVAVVAGEESQVATNLTVSGVQLRPLLNALAGFDSLEGLGEFRIKASGRGRSMDSLMRSLDGNGALDLSDGAILGINLASMVRNLTGQGGGEAQRTDFSAITGTFDIAGGVLNNTDFSFLGPLLRVVGAGTVDIGGQRQNFRLEPTAVASLTGQGGGFGDTGLGIFPILVTGTWSNPRFQPDLSGAVQAMMLNPDGTVEAFKNLIGGGDAGQAVGALLGAVTGGAGGDGSPTTALGQVLGGVAGGDSTSGGDTGGAIGSALGGLLGGKQGGGSTGGSEAPASGIGGLLGALSGSDTGAAASGGLRDTVPQPGAEAGIDAGEFAPRSAPLPRPARRGLAPAAAPASDGTQPAQQFSPAPQPANEGTAEPAGTLPAQTFSPAPQPAAEPAPQAEPAATGDSGTATTAPAAAESQPAPASEAQPAPPAEVTPETPAEKGLRNLFGGGKTDRQGRKQGGSSLDQLLKGVQQ